MSPRSNDFGRAYEFAWLQTLYTVLGEYRPTTTTIVLNSSYEANLSAWKKMSAETKKIYRTSAEAAVMTLIQAEPLMIEDGPGILSLKLMKDTSGEDGDVRDLIISRGDISWEVGLSIKHNHEAVKHSRLSKDIDFGDKWYGLPCSNQYWAGVNPVFAWLGELKDDRIRWCDLTNKAEDVYLPLLHAFMDEVERAYRYDQGVARRMMSYLVGLEDYYKVIGYDDDQLTKVETFNINGTLNQPGRRLEASFVVPVAELPDEIIEMRMKPGSKTTAEIYFNNGWSLSFRIHSASTIVQQSLKFDIEYIGLPVNVLTVNCYWQVR